MNIRTRDYSPAHKLSDSELVERADAIWQRALAAKGAQRSQIMNEFGALLHELGSREYTRQRRKARQKPKRTGLEM